MEISKKNNYGIGKWNIKDNTEVKPQGQKGTPNSKSKWEIWLSKSKPKSLISVNMKNYPAPPSNMVILKEELRKLFGIEKSTSDKTGRYDLYLPSEYNQSNIKDVIQKILEISEKEHLGIKEDDIIIK